MNDIDKLLDTLIKMVELNTLTYDPVDSNEWYPLIHKYRPEKARELKADYDFVTSQPPF